VALQGVQARVQRLGLLDLQVRLALVLRPQVLQAQELPRTPLQALQGQVLEALVVGQLLAVLPAEGVEGKANACV